MGLINRVSSRQPGFQHRGNAENLEEAKLEIERNWKNWMKAVGLLDWPRVDLLAGSRSDNVAFEPPCSTAHTL
jgi:hypothetical protein